MPRKWWQRFLESVLPWWDPDLEAARAKRSEVIHKEAIDARIATEGVIERVEAGGLRGEYLAMDKRLKGRR